MNENQPLVIDGQSRPAVPTFDYDLLPPETAEKARRLVITINSNIHLQVLAVLEIGRDLLSIKDEVKHGDFEAWLIAEFSMSARTARRYMRAAEQFGDKTDTVSVLTTTELHQLVSAPAAVKQQVIEKLDAKIKLTEGEIRNLMVTERRARQAAAANAKLTSKQRKRRKASEARHQRKLEFEREAYAKEVRQREAATAEAAVLIVEKMPDDVPRLLALLDKTHGAHSLVGAIKAAVP